MGAKACLILSILLLSYMLIPADVTAREMLQEPQTAEELKSDVDASRTTPKVLKRGSAAAASKRKPYTGCGNRYGCRGGGHPGHVITPIKPVPAPKGKPYNRPGIPYNPRKGKPYKRPGIPYNPPRQGKPYNRPGIPYNPPRQGKPYKRPGIPYNPPRRPLPGHPHPNPCKYYRCSHPYKRPGIPYNRPRRPHLGRQYVGHPFPNPCQHYRCRPPAP